MNDDFIKKLQKEAKLQKKLHTSRIIPKAFDPLTSFVGENSFLVLFLLSVFSAILLELVKSI